MENIKIAIIDYGSGNLRSAQKAFENIFNKNSNAVITNDPKLLKQASHIVLPGVGAFGDCVSKLRGIEGMIDALSEQILAKEKPFLGICVGMQLLANTGFENGEYKGLGWIPGDVVSLPKEKVLKVPHMGWNDLAIQQQNPLIQGVNKAEDAYFVHSYHFECMPKYVVATTEYNGFPINAIIAHNNIFGTQFHPEKSQSLGLKVLSNFLRC